MEHERIARDVAALYEKIDEGTSRFRSLTGIHCPVGCGTCCESTEVEATPLEFFPLALGLFHDGHEGEVLDRLDNASGDACAFHRPDELCHGKGRCSIYPWRPLTCRLFGYAAVRLKNDRLEMTICSLVGKLLPDARCLAASLMDRGFDPLVFTDVASELRGIDWNLGSQLLPINDAAKEAIEVVGLRLRLEQGRNPDLEDRSGGDMDPETPHTPKRVA